MDRTIENQGRLGDLTTMFTKQETFIRKMQQEMREALDLGDGTLKN